MIKRRLEHKIGNLHCNLFAYQKRKGTQEALASMQNAIGKRNTVVITIDLEKAFEMCDPTVILESLAIKGVKGKLLLWVKDFLSNRNAQTIYQGVLSSVRAFERGTPQGSSLSPLLFNVVMERLLNLPSGTNTLACSIADDLTIIVT